MWYRQKNCASWWDRERGLAAVVVAVPAGAAGAPRRVPAEADGERGSPRRDGEGDDLLRRTRIEARAGTDGRAEVGGQALAGAVGDRAGAQLVAGAQHRDLRAGLTAGQVVEEGDLPLARARQRDRPRDDPAVLGTVIEAALRMPTFAW